MKNKTYLKVLVKEGGKSLNQILDNGAYTILYKRVPKFFSRCSYQCIYESFYSKIKYANNMHGKLFTDSHLDEPSRLTCSS